MTPEPMDQACILVVDDEPVNLKLLDKLLTAQGYRAPVLVQDPRDVLERYRQHRPDLILLDINMPHLDGYQVMAQLQALNDPLLPPIVILTAQLGRDYLVKALAAGARDFVGKPFDRVELLMRVRNLLDAQRAHRLLHDQKAMLEDMVRARTEDLQRDYFRPALQALFRFLHTGELAVRAHEAGGYDVSRAGEVRFAP